jgi:hypothetical protein
VEQSHEIAYGRLRFGLVLSIGRKETHTLAVIPSLTGNRIMRFFKILDYAMPDPIGHDGRKRACYTELLNVQVLILSLSSGVNKHTLLPSFPRCNRGNRTMKFFIVDYAMPDQVGHDGRERACYTELLNVQVLTLSLSSCTNK